MGLLSRQNERRDTLNAVRVFAMLEKHIVRLRNFIIIKKDIKNYPQMVNEVVGAIIFFAGETRLMMMMVQLSSIRVTK